MLTKLYSKLLTIIVVVLLTNSFNCQAQSKAKTKIEADSLFQAYLGLWKTIDDETEQPRSLIRVAIENNQLTARVEKVFPQPGDPEEPICEKCKGELKDIKVIGLNILEGMVFEKDQWRDGEILDPDNGKYYDAKIWLEKDQLKVRGYIGFFFRTQTWLRAEPTINRVNKSNHEE